MLNTQLNQRVFIGGCSRSGTTLLGAMLGSHSECICSPESHFKVDVLRSVAKGLIADANWQAMLQLTQKHWRFKVWELELPPLEVPAGDAAPSYAQILDWIVTQYARQQNQPSARIWVDHTPENISYAHSLLNLYPGAKFVHIVRDGRAVAASILPLDWGPNSIIKAARWWMRLTSFGLAAEAALGPERVMRVKYEELVLEPEKMMRALSDFLALDFQPAMLETTGFNPPSYT
ncbi:MAG: sulfotransferase, partial [Chloroflexi bacterium]|nr:sulfotransferase [Chloroflexota bacterium]